MKMPLAVLVDSISRKEEKTTTNGNLVLPDAFKEEAQAPRLITNVRDDRKCDHVLWPALIPASIKEKVATIVQDRRGKENEVAEATKLQTLWYQQLQQHVARLMNQMRISQPKQFRELLVIAASDPSADCGMNVVNLVDVRTAYCRIRHVAMKLGEDTYHVVRKFVRRSQLNGVLPQDAQVVRFVSLYKLELRRHVTINAVTEYVRSGNSGVHLRFFNAHEVRTLGLGIKKTSKTNPLLRRHIESAGAARRRCGSLESADLTPAVSAPVNAASQGTLNQQKAESGLGDEAKTVHTFKLQALERLLACSWQGATSSSARPIQAVPTTFVPLSEETLAQIQERVTAFLYHQSSRWSMPPLSREETARHLRTLVVTLVSSPLLHSLTIDQVLEMAKAATWQILARGDTLCTQNTEIEALIVVVDGSIVSTTTAEFSLAEECTMITAPACFGELGMVRNAECWSQTLTAQSESAKVVMLSKQLFETLLHNFFDGEKALRALATVTNLLHPQRPSSSPAVTARRLARSVRNPLSVCRPSTVEPAASAVETNISRWRKVCDEKLKKYRADLETEQRAAALEAPRRARDDSSSLPSDEADAEHSALTKSAVCEYHLHSNQASNLTDPTNNESHVYERPSCRDEPQLNGPPLDVTEEALPRVNQLREYYRSLITQRSAMKAKIASSAFFDRMILQSPERICSNTDTTRSEATWSVKEDEAKNRRLPSTNEVERPPDCAVSSVPKIGRNCIEIPSYVSTFSLQANDTVASNPDEVLASPSPLKCVADLPSQEFNPKGRNEETFSKNSDVIWLTEKATNTILETSQLHKNIVSSQSEEARPAATFMQSFKSAYSARLSTATTIRHSKVLANETVTPVLVQEHLADLSGTSAPLSSSRLHSSQSQADQRELNQDKSNVLLRADLQLRLDSALNALQVSSEAKSKVLLKYTHVDCCDQFSTAVELWERVQNVVLWRERVLKSLWGFEMVASDPRRHFRTISTHRLREERERDRHFCELNQATNACVEAMDELSRCCGDSICLGERPYRDKIKKDYTELLFEVEQERLRIIYDRVESRVVPTMEEHNLRDEDDNMSSRLASRSSFVHVHAPSVVPNPQCYASYRSLHRKNGHPSVTPVTTATKYILEGQSTFAITQSNQETRTRSQLATLTIDGASAGPSSMRFSLNTPRESVFVPVSSWTATTLKQEHLPRVSRVTLPVQQQRQAELGALSKRLKKQQRDFDDSTPPSHAIRPPSKTFIARAKETPID